MSTEEAAKDEAKLTPYITRRINLLVSVAIIVVVVCMVVVIYQSNLNEYAQGIITLVLGRFLGYVDLAYAFEFGTTRGSKTKDEVINRLTPPGEEKKV